MTLQATTSVVHDLDEGYLSDQELLDAVNVEPIQNPGADLVPGEFGYFFYVQAPAQQREKCVDAHLIPAGAWSIDLFPDGCVKSWETGNGTQFSERGQAWFEAVKSVHAAQAAQRAADRQNYVNDDVDPRAELSWRDNYNASK